LPEIIARGWLAGWLASWLASSSADDEAALLLLLLLHYLVSLVPRSFAAIFPRARIFACKTSDEVSVEERSLDRWIQPTID